MGPDAMNLTDPTRGLDPRAVRGTRCASGLHFVDSGAGEPPFVLLHGYTDSWRSFDAVFAAFARQRRCVAVDHRGHGDSRELNGGFSIPEFAADVIDVLQEIGGRPAVLVGHSMGSFIARAVALRRPDLVHRLVLVGSAPIAGNPAGRELESQVASFTDAVPVDFVREFQASCVHDPSRLPEGFLDDRVAASLTVPPNVWRRALASLIAYDDRAALSDLRVPTLILNGRCDGFFGPDDQHELASAIADARLVLYDDCGHSPHWELPDRFIADVLDFA